MSSISLSQMDGKRSFIEVREWRRSHRMVVAVLRQEGDTIFAVFSSQYPQHYPDPIRIPIPKEQLAHLEPTVHPEYQLRLRSVLNLHYVESDDTCGVMQPPALANSFPRD